MKSKFIFVKVEKHFKGGFKEVIIPVIKTRYEGYTEAEIIEEVAKEWGEDSDGGHNCGYQIKWSKAKDKVKINEAVNLRIIKARKEIDDYEKHKN